MTDYRGWDTHAYTSLLQNETLLDAFRQATCDPVTILSRDKAAALIADIQDTLVTHNIADTHKTQPVLSKMLARWQTTETLDGYYDAEIGNVNIFSLLAACWQHIVACGMHPTMLHFFVETLLDADQTCVQGDSHRIALFYIALKRDTLESKKEADDGNATDSTTQ